MDFVRARFFKGRDIRTQYVTSSVWNVIKYHVKRINSEARCIMGKNSSVRFWLDNWLGYVIADRLGIPTFVRDFLGFLILDYFCNDTWHLDELFVMKYLNIVEDILK
ncbi:hypothetical protein ACS0TY_006280 [Phlomoides rotata]